MRFPELLLSCAFFGKATEVYTINSRNDCLSCADKTIEECLKNVEPSCRFAATVRMEEPFICSSNNRFITRLTPTNIQNREFDVSFITLNGIEANSSPIRINWVNVIDNIDDIDAKSCSVSSSKTYNASVSTSCEDSSCMIKPDGAYTPIIYVEVGGDAVDLSNTKQHVNRVYSDSSLNNVTPIIRQLAVETYDETTPDSSTTATPDSSTTATPDSSTTATPDSSTTATPGSSTTASPGSSTTASPGSSTGSTSADATASQTASTDSTKTPSENSSTDKDASTQSNTSTNNTSGVRSTIATFGLLSLFGAISL